MANIHVDEGESGSYCTELGGDSGGGSSALLKAPVPDQKVVHGQRQLSPNQKTPATGSLFP